MSPIQFRSNDTPPAPPVARRLPDHATGPVWTPDPRWDGELGRLNFDLPKPLIAAFKARCKETGVSMSAFTRARIEEFLK